MKNQLIALNKQTQNGEATRFNYTLLINAEYN